MDLPRAARISIYVVVVVVLGLSVWLAVILLSGGSPASVEVMASLARQEKEELIGSLSPGRILYIRSEQFPGAGTIFCVLESHSQRVIDESWWEVGADGVFGGISVLRGLDGRLVAYLESTSGAVVYTDVATGWQVSYDFNLTAKSLAGWIEAIWDLPASIGEDGYTFKERSELNGRNSLVYERPPVSESPYGDGRETLWRMEFVEDQPILFRSSIYDVGQGGQRTLSREHTFLEYQVLPEGSKVPTIEVPPPTHPVDPEECPDFHLESPP